MTLFGGRVDDVSHIRIRRRLYYHCRSNLLYYRTERALDKSGISVAPPKRTQGRRVVKSEGPVRVSTRLWVKDQNNDENSESNESSSDKSRKEIESGEEIEKSDEDEGEDMIEDEGEDEGEDMIEDEGKVRHGYTEGRVFPHRTRTRRHRTRARYTPIPTRNSCGVKRNPRYLGYLRFLFIKIL